MSLFWLRRAKYNGLRGLLSRTGFLSCCRPRGRELHGDGIRSAMGILARMVILLGVLRLAGPLVP